MTRSIAGTSELESSPDVGNRVRAVDPGATAADTTLLHTDAESALRREMHADARIRDRRGDIRGPELPGLPRTDLRSLARQTERSPRPQFEVRAPELPELRAPEIEIPPPADGSEPIELRPETQSVSLPDRPELPKPGHLPEREPIPLPDRPEKPTVADAAEAMGAPRPPEPAEAPRRPEKPRAGEAGAEAPVDAEEAKRELGGLSDGEAQRVRELKMRDAEVRRHELAHAAAGGQYAGSPSYEFSRGPDGRSYAVAGSVPIDVSPVAGDPEATVKKMAQVKRAALAPAEPSGADRRVAAQADATAAQARSEVQAERHEEARERMEGAQADDQTAADVAEAIESGEPIPAADRAVPTEEPDDFARGAQVTMMSLAARRAYDRADHDSVAYRRATLNSSGDSALPPEPLPAVDANAGPDEL